MDKSVLVPQRGSKFSTISKISFNLSRSSSSEKFSEN